MTDPQSAHIVVWFKRDLRITDHEPLHRAATLCDTLSQKGYIVNVTPLYVIEPELHAQSDFSQKHWGCIVDCLHDLHHQLQTLGCALVIRTGSAVDVLRSLNPTHILSTEETGNYWTFHRDIAVHRFAKTHAIAFTEYPNAGIVRRLRSRDDWQKMHKARFARDCFSPPTHLPFSQSASEPLPTRIANSQRRTGRFAALQDMHSFTQTRASQYRYSLSRPWPAQQFNSRLSMHLAYGALSVHEVFAALDAVDKEAADTKLMQGLRAMRSRLYWRDHFIQKLESHPAIEFECMHPMMEGLRDIQNQQHLEAWYLGKTGYPIVDACMRCLHHTGWLNFRMRAMVVSFAAYHLWLDWRVFHPLLAQLFADYEPGIHLSQLQMQSGVTGINAIRMYNPIKQSYEKDSAGQFIKYYLPELRHLSDHDVHEPWLFSDYPKPIVDLTEAGQAARKRLAEFRQQPAFKAMAQQVFVQLGSRKSPQRKKRKPQHANKNQRTDDSTQLSLFGDETTQNSS